jgi:predicted aspartyl protease/tetratricopeptide (TPR) repeat protein
MDKHITRRALARRLATSALLALALHLPTASHARCQLKTLEIPVKMVDHRAIATVTIDGTPVPLIVDSGAFYSFLTEAAAQQLQLATRPVPFGLRVDGLTGSVHTRMTQVKHLGVGGGDLSDIEFLVGGNEAGGGGMGLMGRNILSALDTEYDLAHGMIRLVRTNDDCDKANMAYWAGDTPISMVDLLKEGPREMLPPIRATLLLNGHEVDALFDTGATTVVSLDAAHSAGVKDADMKRMGQMMGAGRGKADAWTAAFDRVELGGEAVLHNHLEVGDFHLRGADVLVGIDFFLSHHIYVSKKQKRMYFTYNGGPVFALNTRAPTPEAAASSAEPPASGPADTMSADDYARRGAASLARQEAKAALADLDRACALEPGNGAFFAMRARVHAALKDVDKTAQDLDTALRLDPGQAEARIERAWLRQFRSQRDAALEDLSVLDKTLPPQSQIRLSMATLYESLALPAEALAQWNQWIPAHRHDIALEHAYNGRCWVRAELGLELDKALDDCDEAIDADPKNASYLDSRAWVQLRLGKFAKAKADFDRSLAIRPAGAWSLYGRGLAHLRLGETALAQADLAQARKIEGDIDARIQRAGLPQASEAAQP